MFSGWACFWTSAILCAFLWYRPIAFFSPPHDTLILVPRSRAAPSIAEHPLFFCQPSDSRCEYSCWFVRVLRRNLLLGTSSLLSRWWESAILLHYPVSAVLCTFLWCLLIAFFAPIHGTWAWLPRSRAMHHPLLIILSSSARPLIFVVNTLADPFVFFGEACFWAPAIFFVLGVVGHPFVISSGCCSWCVCLVFCQQLSSPRLMIHEPEFRKLCTAPLAVGHSIFICETFWLSL